MAQKIKKSETNGVYYYTPQSDSSFNMAFDNWLFEKIQRDNKFPRVILRLYTWKKPAITLGYNQNVDKVIDFNQLDESVPVIRRITGGRAIYHDETEITFSLTADLNIFPEKERSLSKTNELISVTVVEALESVGVMSEWEKKSDSSFTLPATGNIKSCFNSYSRYEIFSPNGKIVAGAQRRKGDYIIHQGSLKINGISDCQAVGQKNETGSLSGGENCVNSYVYTISQFREIFLERFSENLNIKLTEQMIDDEFHREISFLALKLNKIQ
ncbi:MAG: lipoate--protein ligase family protein [candidate division Zixibacteria bacterium]|nr:lipoate--protein ligase family protein [candidate division Zixibacteria bacterium]